MFILLCGLRKDTVIPAKSLPSCPDTGAGIHREGHRRWSLTNMPNPIPLILTAALATLITLACANPPPRDPTPTQPSPGPETLASLEPSAVCDVLTRRDLQPYDRLIDPSDDADAITQSGWTFRERPPFSLEPPIDWENLASTDRSWNFALNSWRPVNSILAQHSLSSQTSYLSFAIALAADWIDKNPYCTAEIDVTDEDFGW